MNIKLSTLPAHAVLAGVFLLALLLSACNTQQTRNEIQQNTATARPHDLPEISICHTPEPKQPSSAFNFQQSPAEGKSGYWVRYQCKRECQDWRSCLVAAYAEDGGKLLTNGRHPEVAKQSLAFVVDGMAGHLALSSDGDKTVFIHTGAGGTRYYIKPAETLEQRTTAKTVMIRWEKGYVSPIVQAPFTQAIGWGWYSRTSAEPTNIKSLNKRVASIMAWTHDKLTKDAMFGTLACSMGTNATFGPVLWHGLDPIIDYQVFVGGPNMWDLNAQCGRRHYSSGYCELDGVSTCRTDKDCQQLGSVSHCVMPSAYTTIDRLFEQLPNHIHATDACDIRASDAASMPYPGFDESSMGFASGADWQIVHKVDFLVNLGARQGASYDEGLGGDRYWALGNFPYVYNKIKPDSNKHWYAYPDSHHCDATFDEALDILKERMDM